MYKAFIEPDLQQAQLVVVNHFNPFSGFMNPIYILKSSKKVEKGLVQKILKVWWLWWLGGGGVMVDDVWLVVCGVIGGMWWLEY